MKYVFPIKIDTKTPYISRKIEKELMIKWKCEAFSLIVEWHPILFATFPPIFLYYRQILMFFGQRFRPKCCLNYDWWLELRSTLFFGITTRRRREEKTFLFFLVSTLLPKQSSAIHLFFALLPALKSFKSRYSLGKNLLKE
jgi:hypothetical protein